MSFPAYPEYKDSGVAWLGEVPSHWEVVPLWTLYRRTKRTGFPDEELLSVYRDFGVLVTSSRDDNFNKASEDLGVYQVVNCGDLVINKMKAWQGSVGVSAFRGIVSPAYFVFEPLHSMSSRYLHYLFRSEVYFSVYMAMSKGIRINQWDLDPQSHSRLSVLLPPIVEQTAIAAFLDYETAKIDALIAEQEKLIELLKEKRLAVISHAVTKGLDPNAPMKDSGVEWLGKVPEHWDISSVKYLVASIEQGWSPQCENFPALLDGEWGILKVGCVNGGIFNPQENKALPAELDPVPSLCISANDVIISRANTKELVGSCAVACEDYPNLLLCDKLYRLRMERSKISPHYFSYLLSTCVVRSKIEAFSNGASSSMQNIGQGVILNLQIPVPRLEEQDLIVDNIFKELVGVDALLAESQGAITLLKERRSALISAAVTGKIDVRGYAPQQEAV